MLKSKVNNLKKYMALNVHPDFHEERMECLNVI